jgi:hypothetical protein
MARVDYEARAYLETSASRCRHGESILEAIILFPIRGGYFMEFCFYGMSASWGDE